jgi:Trypsin-co-occurring domain 2
MDDAFELATVLASLREALHGAMEHGSEEGIRFPVDGIDIEFRVGVTRDVSASAKLRFWVLELGGGGSFKSETVHTVRVRLGEPETFDGTPVKVSRRALGKP